jgi:RHS repeat-associated protein
MQNWIQDRQTDRRGTRDAEHYNYFRDYDPSLGRYIESDPIGFVGGINTFRYVGGNPLIYGDPGGLKSDVPGDSSQQILKWDPNGKSCQTTFAINWDGPCRNGDTMCAISMNAAGIQGPYFPKKKTVGLKCFLSLGFAVKAPVMAAGNHLAKKLPAAVSPIWRSPGSGAIGVGYTISELMEVCEVEPDPECECKAKR